MLIADCRQIHTCHRCQYKADISYVELCIFNQLQMARISRLFFCVYSPTLVDWLQWLFVVGKRTYSGLFKFDQNIVYLWGCQIRWWTDFIEFISLSASPDCNKTEHIDPVAEDRPERQSLGISLFYCSVQLK